MYAEFKTEESKFNFDDFRIDDSITGESAHIGQTLNSVSANPVISIRCINPDYARSEARIDLIKNGQLIKTFLSSDENINIQYEDASQKVAGKSYYRLKISALGKVIYTNPIFVI